MGRNKRTRISQIREGKELEAFIKYYNWVRQGTIEKCTSVFVPLSDDRDGCEDPVYHNARRIIEEQN